MELFDVSGMWVLALGKTLIHSLWIGLLILALLRLTLSYIPVSLSALRYGISVSALLLLFLSIIITFFLLFEPLTSLQEVHSVVLTYQGEVALRTSLVFKLSGYFYLTGILFMLFRSWASIVYIRGLRNSGKQLASAWQIRLKKTSESIGIKRSVDFLESTRIKAPLVVGYLKPVLMVPAGMISNLPLSQIETILLHELYHLKRNDYLINLLQLFIEGVLFYHPAVWIISGCIRSEREHCCDDCVLNTTENPLNYAKALIHLAEQQHYTRLTPGAVGSEKRQFEARIKRILKYDTMRTNMREKILSLTLLTASIILLLTVSGFSAGPAFLRIHKTNSEPLTISVNPLDNVLQDTIPLKEQKAEIEEVEEPEGFESEAMEEEFESEAMETEIEDACHETLEAIEEIDWEEIRVEMELSISDMKIDIEEMKIDIENSINGIDWDEISEEIRIDLRQSKVFLDSIMIEMEL